MADCQNPVFKDINSWGGTERLPLDLRLADSPGPYPTGGQTCSYYRKRKNQCCTTESLAAVEDALALANLTLTSAVRVINKAPFINQLEQTVREACDTIQCSDDVYHKINGYFNLLDSTFKAFQDAQIECTNALLAYTQGMMCFACESEYPQFLNETAFTVELAVHSCSEVRHKCQPVHDAMNRLVRTSTDFVNEICKDVAGMTPIDICKTPDMCGGTFCKRGDCSHYTCHQLLNGFTLPSYTWGAHLPQLTETQTPTTARDAKEQLAESLRVQHNAWVGAVADANSVFRGPVQVASEPSHNVYSKNGYDSYEVGCVDLKCPAQWFEPTYWRVFLGLSIVMVLSIVACMYIRRKKMNTTR